MTKSLQDRVKDLTSSIDKFNYEKKKDIKTSTVGRISTDINMFQKFFFEMLSGLLWIFNILIKPFSLWLLIPAKYLLSKYIKLWTYLVYVKDEYNISVFSKIRAGITIICTLFVVLFLIGPTLELVFDTGFYFTTANVNEKLYLNGSQQLDANSDQHAVEGCMKLPCSDADAVYFRTKSSLFNDAWSLIHRGSLFYPDQVASGVPYDISECVITSYGLRMRFLIRNFNIYPSLLAFECRPVADGRGRKDYKAE